MNENFWVDSELRNVRAAIAVSCEMLPQLFEAKQPPAKVLDELENWCTVIVSTIKLHRKGVGIPNEVRDWDIPARPKNCLLRGGIVTLADYLSFASVRDVNKWGRFRNYGVVSHKLILDYLLTGQAITKPLYERLIAEY